jgi:hypothetical protein
VLTAALLVSGLLLSGCTLGITPQDDPPTNSFVSYELP